MAIIDSQEDQVLLKTYSLRFFDQLFKPLLKSLPQDFISNFNPALLKFFKKTFNMPKRLIGADTLVVDSIVSCFSAFVLNLNEDSMRPMLTKLSKWAMKQKGDEYNLDKANIMCRLLTGLLETLREFFIPLIVPICFEPVLLPLMNTVSTQLSAKSQKLGNKRAREDENVEDNSQNNDKAISLLSVLATTLR